MVKSNVKRRKHHKKHHSHNHHLASGHLTPDVENHAATQIQSAHRGRQARKEREVENRAATRIQSAHRGRMVRRTLAGATLGAHSTITGVSRSDRLSSKHRKAAAWAHDVMAQDKIRRRAVDQTNATKAATKGNKSAHGSSGAAATGEQAGAGTIPGATALKEDHAKWVANQEKARREEQLKKQRMKSTSHWDSLEPDAAEYGEEPGETKGSAAAVTQHDQLATWQNGLGDFAAHPSVCCKSIICPCVQYGVNAAAVYDGFHSKHCCTAQADRVKRFSCKCPRCCCTWWRCCCCSSRGGGKPSRSEGAARERRPEPAAAAGSGSGSGSVECCRGQDCCIEDVCLLYAVGCLVLWPLCCCLPALGGGCARYRLRRRLGIAGSCWADVLAHCAVPCCAIIQEGAELSFERKRVHAEQRAEQHIMRLERGGAAA